MQWWSASVVRKDGCSCGMSGDLSDFIALTSFDAQGNFKYIEITLL